MHGAICIICALQADHRPAKLCVFAGRNIAKLSLNSAHGLRIYDLLRADQIAIEKSALEHINSFFGPKADAAEVPSFASTPASGVPDAPTKDADAAPESG